MARTQDEKGIVTVATLPDQALQFPFSERDDRLARHLRPELYFQVTRDHVSFDHIAKAWWMRNDPAKRVCPEVQRASQFLEYLARRQFATEHKGIEKDYWSKEPWGACALTGDGWVHSVMNSDDPELVLYEDRVHQLCRDVHRTFDASARQMQPDEGNKPSRARSSQKRSTSQKVERDLKDAGEMLYSVLTRVIFTASVLDDKHATQRRREEALAAVRVQWRTVRTSVGAIIQRQARFEYFEGVGLGALITIPALAVAGWMVAQHGGSHFSEPGGFTAAIIGGATGAVISVAQRMTANTLLLDFSAPKYQKIALGALRPIVGAISGAVVYFAIIGGLLAVQARTGKDAAIELAFFAVAGFAAGFSERFATDVLDRASSGLLPTRGQQGVEYRDEPSLLLSEQPRHAEMPIVAQQAHRPSRSHRSAQTPHAHSISKAVRAARTATTSKQTIAPHRATE